MDIAENVRRFREYAAGFTEGPAGFGCRLKLDHTMDVLAVARRIMAGEGVTASDRVLAGELAALYHDLARFEQFRKFHTFLDSRSFDHGSRSAEMLETGTWLEGAEENLRQEVIQAVRFHNKRALPGDLPRAYLFTAKLVRDADKISIYHVVLEFLRHRDRYAGEDFVTLDLPDIPVVHHHLLEVVRSGGSISMKELSCVNDFLLNLFCWVNDINFTTSRRIIAGEDIYPQIREFLPPDAELDALMQELLRKLTGD